MTDRLPMFPLNSVMFPGVTVPLHVFEDRYRALMHHLLRIDDPAERLFGSVAIREGYEVGDHGAQSLFRVGVRLQLTEVEGLPEPTVRVPEELVGRARATFTAYRQALSEISADPYSGALPTDVTYLSWVLAACAPLPMSERQQLLEASDAEERLVLVTELLRSELRAMNVITSLPATEVARTRWSPN